MTRYRATLDTGSSIETWTIADARRWAEAHGTLAARCTIVDLDRWAPRADHPRRVRPVVAVHVRDTAGDGRRWFRGDPGPAMIDDGATIDRDPAARLRWPGGGA